MRLTRQHKLFHVAVFGAIAVLAMVFVVLKREYRAAYTTARPTLLLTTTEHVDDGPAAARTDMYGGRTPEETFGKFFAALKTNDTELASRYFVTAHQAEWREVFALLKTGGGLGALAEELDTVQRVWKKDTSEPGNARYVYEKLLHDGTTSVQIVAFEKDNISGIWKIREL